MRRKKGFTLIELVVVIAIFGILLAVVTPAWAHYLQRSRTRAQNQKARAVFNAAQTVVTKLDFQERKYKADGSPNAMKHVYTPSSGEWFYYWNGTSGHMCKENDGDTAEYSSAASTETNDYWDKTIGDSIRRIVTEDMIYKIWVKDYKIVAVASANKPTDRYIGAHPTTIFDLRANGISTDSISDRVSDVKLGWFDLDLTSNPS